jgi:hypothetical protein|tara:strand:- start:244 stop:510 length:267 start_codon:yes stop_codon:yes gene_type:complete
MKKYLLIMITVMFTSNYSFAASDTKECDKIKHIMKTGKKIDCIVAAKTKKIIKPIISSNTKMLNAHNEKKKKFDKENNTLMKLFKLDK